MNNPDQLKAKVSVNLHDFRRAYLHKDLKTLRFTYYMFSALQHPWLVKILTGLASFSLRLRLPVKKLIRSTIYKVFCAGETTDEALQTIRGLEWYHVSAVLDYVSEGENRADVFERNKNIILSNIRRLGTEAPGSAVSVKLTGLEDVAFLARINGLAPATLKEADLERYKKYVSRVDQICAACATHNVIIYIDAEERRTQDGFDDLVCCMMARYNKERAIVYNTLQMYLRDRYDHLLWQLQHARQHGYFAGIKLVRGAYVEKERERAARCGVPSPVHETKEDTDAAFDKALVKCLENATHVYTCIASHNERSTLLALQQIAQHNISDHMSKVRFSQLFGMSDNLTFNLAARGFSASKYIPYGEVDKAIPYLIRRAEENSSIGGQMPKELTYLKAELKRRKLQQQKQVQ